MDTGWLGGFVLFCFYRRVRIGGALILSAANASGGFLRSFRRYRKEPLALCFTLQQATGDEAFFINGGSSIGGVGFRYGMAGLASEWLRVAKDSSFIWLVFLRYCLSAFLPFIVYLHFFLL